MEGIFNHSDDAEFRRKPDVSATVIADNESINNDIQPSGWERKS
jgi:hypothetical protein